jgi:hypothetical protein
MACRGPKMFRSTFCVPAAGRYEFGTSDVSGHSQRLSMRDAYVTSTAVTLFSKLPMLPLSFAPPTCLLLGVPRR